MSTEMAIFSGSASCTKGGQSSQVPGTVTLTSTQVRWTASNPGDAPASTLEVASLTAIQRKRAGAPSCRLVGSNKQALILQFENEQERDKLADEVAKLIKAKTKAQEKSSAEAAPQVPPAELAARKALLDSNREIKRLHEELVGAGTLSEADFWQARKNDLGGTTVQRVGIANAMADVRATSDGRSNTLKFNLTPEMKFQIFAEKPAVRDAFITQVPKKMTEVQFWTRYCRALYYMKMSEKGQGPEGEEEAADIEMFAGGGASNRDAMMRKVRKIDPTVNLVNQSGDSLASGYGIVRDGGKETNMQSVDEEARRLEEEGGPPVPLRPRQPGATTAHDLNRHAAVVLDGRPEALGDAPSAEVIAAITTRADQAAAGAPADVAGLEASWQRAVRERETREAMPDLRGAEEAPRQPLRIQDPRRYFAGAPDAGPAPAGPAPAAPAPASRVASEAQAMEWRGAEAAVGARAAAQVLSEVAGPRPGAAESVDLTGPGGGGAGAGLEPAALAAILQKFKTCQELLRHFWVLQPPTTPVKVAKSERINEAMTALYDKLQAQKREASTEQRHGLSRILQPIFRALDAAFEYHDDYKQRAQQPAAAPGTIRTAVASAPPVITID